MKKAIPILLLSFLLLSSCSTQVAKRERSLALQAEALTLLDDKEYGRAVALFEEAVDLMPKASEGRYNLVLALLANGQFDEAVTLSDASFTMFPAHLEFLLAKAFAYRQKGDLDEAFALYSEILEKDKGNFPLQAALMEVALESGYFDFAKDRALFLLSVHKEEARAFGVLATLEGEESWYGHAYSLMKGASAEDLEQRQEQSR